jgi:response regulator RpfG family c-di-GMP phosphodiesterase
MVTLLVFLKGEGNGVAGGRGLAEKRRMTPQEQNFADYKNAERKALEIVATMKATSPKKADIEVALLVALFELHKGQTAPGTVGKIIQSHLETIVPFYMNQAGPSSK